MDFSTGSGYLNRMESTAMSDIIFNLLIFFLLSSSFIVQSGIQIDLPRVVQATPLELKQVVVTLKPEGELFINERATEWTELREVLALALDAAEERIVIIRGDDQAPLGRVVQIMETAGDLGVSGLGIATRQTAPDDSD